MWLALLVVGCTENEFALGEPSPSEDAAESTRYRIDVIPPAQRADLLPATFIVDPEAVGVLAVRPPVDVTGCVAGYAITPTTARDANLPGATVPVPATVRLGLAGTAQTALTATSPVDGCFSMRVVPSAGYDLSIVPLEPTIPFLSDVLSLTESSFLSVDLGSGVGVYGRVVDGGGQPLRGAEIWAEDAFGTRGTSAFTDTAGWYDLRVEPGSYTIVSNGRNNGRDPRIVSSLRYIGDEGAAIDVAYPTLDTVSVSGRLAGQGVAGATARFTALSLDGYEDEVALVVEAVANGNGNFDTRLLRGTWRIELIPPASLELTPLDLGDVAIGGEVDLGTLQFPGLVSTATMVVDPGGAPVPGTLVQCTEVGFGHRTTTATSTEAGVVGLRVPRVLLSCVLTPPANRPDLAITRVDHDPGESGSLWVLDPGVELIGQVVLAVAGSTSPLSGALIEVRDTKGRFLGTTITGARDGSFALRVGWPD